jgi:hypothetical protein
VLRPGCSPPHGKATTANAAAPNPTVNPKTPSPEVGDRVQIDGSGAFYVVVEVKIETETVSVLPEPEVVQAPFDQITSTSSRTSQRP